MPRGNGLFFTLTINRVIQSPFFLSGSMIKLVANMVQVIMKIDKASSLKQRWAILTLMLGAMISMAVGYSVNISNQRYIKQSVHDSANASIESILSRINIYQYGLRGARGAILTMSESKITRQAFKDYSLTRDLDTEFVGARGFGFIRRVPLDQEVEFVQAAQADGWPDFKVRQLNPHDDDRYIIKYIEPVETNLAAVGLDIASEANRRRAADESLASGEVRLTGPITLVQATGQPQQSFLIMLPIYKTAKTPTHLYDRITMGLGWAYAPLIISDMLAGQHFDSSEFVLKISDVTDTSDHVTFFNNADDSSVEFYTSDQTHNVFGRMWTFTFSVTSLYIKQLNLLSPTYVIIVGLIISTLVSLLVGVVFANKQRRNQLIAEKAKLASIVESSADGIISKLLDGTITSWNRGAEKIFGFKSEEALGRSVLDLIIPESLKDQEASIIARVSRGEAVSDMDTFRLTKYRELVPVSITISPIYSDSGKVVGASKTVRDISLQKANQDQINKLNENLEEQVQQRTEELFQSNMLLNNVLDASSQFSIIATNKEGIITLFNAGAERMLGYQARQLVGLSSPAILHLEEEVALRATELSQIYRCQIDAFRVFVHIPELEGAETREWTYVDKNGQHIPVLLVVTTMRDHDNEITGYLGIAQNISESKRQHNELILAKQQADAANAAKSVFLANMSHEIRTPMNAVLGMLQLVRRTELTVRQAEYVDNIHLAATSLLRLLNDILDYSKIDAQKLQLDCHSFSIEVLLRDLAVVLAPNIKTKDVELLFAIDADLPSYVIGDGLRLQQILINLASNALKFTEHGEVVVGVKLIQCGDDLATIRISVDDSGIGISSEQQERIFESFTQAEASTTRRYGGTGLGLVISRSLVNLMNGELAVESELGHGSRFWFDITLPVDTNYAPLSSEFPSIDRSYRILVVDDNAIALEVLSGAVAALGATVDTATCGYAAIEQYDRSLLENHPIDVIFLDWRMPDIDGVTVARQIKASAAAVQQNPVIIMATAFGHDELDKYYHQDQPPFDVFLTKPLTLLQISGVLSKVVNGEELSSNRVVSIAQSDKLLLGVNLLLVEDNPFNRQIASELLEFEGANIDMAMGGLEGVQKVLAGTTTRYDVVLMDIQMPDLDGLEATRQIRADERFNDLPIIAMTANVSAQDQKDCLDAGMNGHLGKPLDIVQVVKTILHHLGGSPDIETLSSANSVKPPLDKLPDNQSLKAEVFNSIINRFGGNQQLYSSLLREFEHSLDEQLKEIEQAINNQAWSDLLLLLHSLKGTSGTMGVINVYQVVAEKESLIKSQEHATDDSLSIEITTGLVPFLKAMAAESIADIRGMLSDSVDDSAEISLAEFNIDKQEIHNRFNQMERYLVAGNLKAFDILDSLQPMIGQVPALRDEWRLLLKACDAMDFEKALEALTVIKDKL
jgi:PAS domain S-box-containing protein